MTEEVSQAEASNNIQREPEELVQVSQATIPPWEEEPIVSPLVEERTVSQPVEKPIIREEPQPITPSSASANRTFAPLNIPLSRRRQTLTILVWFLLPWTCFYISFLLLRCNNWYVVGAFVLYLTWMMLLQKYPREGGFKQQWLRRLPWWKWFAGKH